MRDKLTENYLIFRILMLVYLHVASVFQLAINLYNVGNWIHCSLEQFILIGVFTNVLGTGKVVKEFRLPQTGKYILIILFVRCFAHGVRRISRHVTATVY